MEKKNGGEKTENWIKSDRSSIFFQDRVAKGPKEGKKKNKRGSEKKGRSGRGKSPILGVPSP